MYKNTLFFTSFSRLRSTGKSYQAHILCSNVRTSTGCDGGLQYSPTFRLRCLRYSEKLRKNCLFAHFFGCHVFAIFSTSIAQINTKLSSLCQWAPKMPLKWSNWSASAYLRFRPDMDVTHEKTLFLTTFFTIWPRGSPQKVIRQAKWDQRVAPLPVALG